MPHAAVPLRPTLASAALLSLAACGSGGDGPTDPPDPVIAPGVRAVAGASVADTIDAQPIQVLVVEVRRPDGALARGAVVRFEAQPPADGARRAEAGVYVCPLSAQTCGPGGASGQGAQFTSDTTDA